MGIAFVDCGDGYAGMRGIPLQDRFALTAAQVARALSDGGIQTTRRQVSLLTRVVTTPPIPALDILSVEPRGSGQPAQHSRARSQVKLACHPPGGVCPFAIASWSTIHRGARGESVQAAPPVTRNMTFIPKKNHHEGGYECHAEDR